MPIRHVTRRRAISPRSMGAHARVNTVADTRARHASLYRGVVIGLTLPMTVVGLYLFKSALGINLLAGPSPLHNLLYHFVR